MMLVQNPQLQGYFFSHKTKSSNTVQVSGLVVGYELKQQSFLM
jgi:hypothetical protein